MGLGATLGLFFGATPDEDVAWAVTKWVQQLDLPIYTLICMF